jgi:CO/xanthine dehydrogenase Mo-binding subunit
VYTNRQPTSAMRGFGVFEASFAVEVQMERDARELDMDPFEFRLLNAYRNGDVRSIGKLAEDATLVETLKAAAELVGHELPERFQAMNSDDRHHQEVS